MVRQGVALTPVTEFSIVHFESVSKNSDILNIVAWSLIYLMKKGYYAETQSPFMMYVKILELFVHLPGV